MNILFAALGCSKYTESLTYEKATNAGNVLQFMLNLMLHDTESIKIMLGSNFVWFWASLTLITEAMVRDHH